MADPNEDDRMQKVLHAYWILSTQAKLIRRFRGELSREELSQAGCWAEAIQTKLVQRFPGEFFREELDEILISRSSLWRAIKRFVRGDRLD
jgi:hypothetical protein